MSATRKTNRLFDEASDQYDAAGNAFEEGELDAAVERAQAFIDKVRELKKELAA